MWYFDRLCDTVDKMRHILRDHKCVVVSVSGGSDSNIIVDIICKHFKDEIPKMHFVFLDTGFEYEATRRHLKYMEEHYGIKIEKIRGEPIPLVIKREGIPLVSKQFSHQTMYMVKGSKWALDIAYGRGRCGEKSKFAYSPKKLAIAEYCIENNIKVSNKCCYFSKKKPIHQYIKDIGADLNITGERKAEGGLRAEQKSCFSEHQGGVDKYMPLFWWEDDEKQEYKEEQEVRFSDCYEVYGMKRTGCVGCPYNSKAGRDLEILKKYEPKMYKACLNVFGESYRIQDKFGINRQRILPDENEPEQLKLF